MAHPQRGKGSKHHKRKAAGRFLATLKGTNPKTGGSTHAKNGDTPKRCKGSKQKKGRKEMKKEEFINMYMNAGQKEKELIESLLKGTQETEKVYKVTDTNGNAVFVCFSLTDAKDLIAQNPGKGLTVVEESAELFLKGSKDKYIMQKAKFTA